MDEIKVSVTASTSQATAQLEDFGSRSKAAMEAYNAAASKSKTTSEALGKAFDQGMSSGLSFTEAMEKATASVTSYAGAADRAATATRGVTSTFYAAQGASGLLEGRIPIRAMERFLASSQAVSTALMAAFPVIGAIAIAEVLVRAGEALTKFASDAAALGRELGTGWMDGAIAQISGLGKEIKQTDDELMKLAQDRDQIRERQQGSDVEHARLQAQVDEYKKLTAGLGPENAKNAQAYSRAAAEATAAGEKAADSLHAEQLQRQIDALEKIKTLHVQSAEAIGKEINSQDEVSRVGSLGIDKLRKDEELSTSQYQDALKQQLLLIQEKNDLLLKGQIADQRETRAARPGKEKEPLGVRIEVDESLQEERAAIAALKADTRAQEEYIATAFDREQKGAQEAYALEIKSQREAAEAYRDKARAIAEVVEQNDAENRAARSIYEAQIAASQASGSITKVAADQLRAADDAAYYADRIAELKQELAQLVPSTEEYLRVQRQLTQVQAQAKVSQINDQSKTAQDISQPYVNAFNTINGAWLQMQNKLIFGTKNVSQAFANMGVSILESGAAWIEKWLAQQLAAYIRDQIAHQVSENTKLGQLIAAMATRKAITGPANAAEATSNTAVAATGAAASQAPIPIVGPELAAAAAASMTALLAPFIGMAAFETGGIIPNTGVALVHQGEGVLPRNLTNMLTSVANSYGGSSSNTSVSSTSHFNGITDRNFRDMARRNGEAVFDAAHKAVRGGRRRVS